MRVLYLCTRGKVGFSIVFMCSVGDIGYVSYMWGASWGGRLGGSNLGGGAGAASGVSTLGYGVWVLCSYSTKCGGG